MRKVLISIAAVALSIVPVAGSTAFAMTPGGTNISSSQNQSNNLQADRSNTNNSSQTAYYNASVSYEALYYVKYAATETYYTNDTQNSANNASLMDNYMNNSQNRFNMPSSYQYN